MDLTNQYRKGKKTRERADFTMIYGKVPPQALDLEEVILGAIMMNRDAYETVSGILTAETFYSDVNQKVFRAITSLAHKSKPIDILTVKEELRAREELDQVGGEYALVKMTQFIASAANIEAHARIIIEKYMQREVIRICCEVLTSAYEDSIDVFDLLNDAEDEFSKISQLVAPGDVVEIGAVLVKAMQKIEEWRQLDDSITGVPCGFEQLDKATRGWQDGDLIIIAARPSVGKTAFALNIIRNAALHYQKKNSGQSVAVWSLEMKSVMLVLRMIAAESEELLHRIQTGRLDEAGMKRIYREGVQKLSSLGIFFDDSSGLTIQKLRAKARKLKRKNQLGLIVIDYLQLMTAPEKSGTREQEVGKISRELKNLAQELSVPVIALSQLSREVEKRTGSPSQRRPQLSDLRESGSLEQDADVVIFLWGPTEEEIQQDPELYGRRYARIAKQRNGMLITCEMNFKNEIQLFTEVAAAGGSWKPVDNSARLLIDPSEPKKNSFEEEDPF